MKLLIRIRKCNPEEGLDCVYSPGLPAPGLPSLNPSCLLSCKTRHQMPNMHYAPQDIKARLSFSPFFYAGSLSDFCLEILLKSSFFSHCLLLCKTKSNLFRNPTIINCGYRKEVGKLYRVTDVTFKLPGN